MALPQLGNSLVEIGFDPKEIRVEANLISKNMKFCVKQHIQNPPKSVSGKMFYSENCSFPYVSSTTF